MDRIKTAKKRRAKDGDRKGEKRCNLICHTSKSEQTFRQVVACEYSLGYDLVCKFKQVKLTLHKTIIIPLLLI